MLKIKLALYAQSNLTVALTTVNWSTIARLKRYFGVFAALGAYCGKHLASRLIAAISVSLCFPCCTAYGTTLGLISKALGLEKLLFLSAESEGSPTFGTLDRLVLKTH
jgi:hypothetical protein